MAALKGRTPQVLLVEDNPADVRLFQCALEDLGDWPLSLTVAGDGEKATDLLLRSGREPSLPAPDLVILDLNLPRLSGSEVLKWIRTASARPTLPTYILSSCPQDISIQKVRAQGVEADGYYEKPADFETFVALIADLRERFETRTHSGNSAHSNQ